MTKVQHTARLHEKTVQRIALGQGLYKKQRQHTTPQLRWYQRVDPRVMEMVRRVRRPGTTLHIINEDTVLIINKEN